MALLELKDIGKIYVSEGEVAVGIRGVSASFEKGEFVAVTGASGSGKSTFLNVISGIDTYEEGELLIEGQPTSHYMQSDWEAYRQEYISFIFQDYNIMDSFTVLQNVELALMDILDPRERRKKAMELLTRVGLKRFVHNKGSKLSGGQKQRAVIARALAKDSPIILADEPTGNLDSETSKEIIELLHEVSAGKLLIMVTHNYEQVEQYATRHIRIFDGSIESDHMIQSPAPKPPVPEEEIKETKKAGKKDKQFSRRLANGWTLGWSMFTARPKMTLFLCALFLLGTIGVFFVTSLCGEAGTLFQKDYMFYPMDGRLVVATKNGESLPKEKIEQLAADTGASSVFYNDMLLDVLLNSMDADGSYFDTYRLTTKKQGSPDVGRYPTGADEVFLSLPISDKPYWDIKIKNAPYLYFYTLKVNVVGIHYYTDNRQERKMVVTQDGWDLQTANFYLLMRSSLTDKKLVLSAGFDGGEETPVYWIDLDSVIPMSLDRTEKILILPQSEKAVEYQQKLQSYRQEANVTVSEKAVFQLRRTSLGDYSYTTKPTEPTSYEVAGNLIAFDWPSSLNAKNGSADIVVDSSLLCEMADKVLEKEYHQVSIFYKNDRAAKKAAAAFTKEGMIATPAKTEYSPETIETILMTVSALLYVFIWFFSIVFMAFFIHLCSQRALDFLKSDLAILRSMGIQTNAIRIGIYIRMMLSLIPGFLITVIGTLLLFRNPIFNAYFRYMDFWQYIVIMIGILILLVRVTKKQIKRLFSDSVKKSLKGGMDE